MKKYLPAIFLFCLHFIPGAIIAQHKFEERIISFNSEIIINEDASMEVTERIKIHAEGNKIKRGIYRDFPTIYEDDYGNNYIVKFEVLGIKRDSRQESYHTERLSNGIRVYIGKENYFLPAGDYIYEIKYATNRQIGYFDSFDELYWNVTGNGWEFEIERTTATVNLPSGVSGNEIKALAYTGFQGDRGQDYFSKIKSPGKVYFETTQSLNPNKGLTIVVQFPKGLVSEPTDTEKVLYFLDDNKSILFGAAGILIVLFYYLFIWWRMGKDPTKGLVIPMYEPPDKLSPAAVRFISEMGFDNKVFTSALISLAVKGYLQIVEDNKDYYLVKKFNNTKQLTPDERVVYERLKFKSENGEYILELKRKNHSTLQNTIKGLKDSLKRNYEKNYFITNRNYFLLGAVISLIFLIMSSLNSNEEQIFSLVWVSFWSIGVAALLFSVYKAWKGVLGKGSGKVIASGSAIFITIFSIPFIIGEIAGLYLLSEAGSPFIIVVIALLVIINIAFYHLLKAPTLLGRKVMDKIDGFKMYLGVAEKDRLESIKEPEKTVELFEMFLPYSLALNVENSWAEKFTGVFESIKDRNNVYSPVWYSGKSWSTFGASGLASSISGSLDSAISASSTSPGSSSGGGSGGSSGGGGGGGGGGGW